MKKDLTKSMSISSITIGLLGIIEKYWWLLVTIAIVAIYGIIMILSRGQSIWFDENYSITIARRPIGQLLALTAVDAHPPFYYLILKAWGSIFGWSEFALRSLSAVAASLTAGVAILLIRRLFTFRIALVTLPFLLLSPFFLRYGYEVRMYALVGLIGMVATWVLFKAMQGRNIIWWIVYGALVALGMYTLYMSVVIWFAHLVWLILQTYKNKKSFRKQPWIGAYFLAILLFLPYVPTFLFQMTHSALPGIGSVLTITTLSGLLGLIVSYVPSWQIGGLLSLALLMVTGLGIYLMTNIYKKASKTERSNLQLLLFCFFVPLVFFVLVSFLPKPFFINRYAAHIVIYIYLLFGIITALGWRYGYRRAALLFGGLLIILLSLGVSQLQRTGNFNFERMQYPMTAAVRQSVICNSLTEIIADDPYTYIDASYYFDGCQLKFYSQHNVDFSGGYAPLHNSSARVASASSVVAPILYHLHWAGGDSSFSPSKEYHLLSSVTFDKQVVDRYARQ